MSLVDDLRAARALIDTPEKWHRGWYKDGLGHFCALGACREVTGDGDASEAALALHSQLPPRFRSVDRFNDDPATTHPDVLALFDRAISTATKNAKGG